MDTTLLITLTNDMKIGLMLGIMGTIAIQSLLGSLFRSMRIVRNRNYTKKKESK